MQENELAHLSEQWDALSQEELASARAVELAQGIADAARSAAGEDGEAALQALSSLQAVVRRISDLPAKAVSDELRAAALKAFDAGTSIFRARLLGGASELSRLPPATLGGSGRALPIIGRIADALVEENPRFAYEIAMGLLDLLSQKTLADLGQLGYQFVEESARQAFALAPVEGLADFVWKGFQLGYGFALHGMNLGYEFARHGMDLGYMFARHGMDLGYLFSIRGEEVGPMADRVLFMAVQIGQMADRIGEMADRILFTEVQIGLMADRIGEMADRIVYMGALIVLTEILIVGVIEILTMTGLSVLSLILGKEEAMAEPQERIHELNAIFRQIIAGLREFSQEALAHQVPLRESTLSSFDGYARLQDKWVKLRQATQEALKFITQPY